MHQHHLPDESPSLIGFEFLLAPHGLTAGWKLLRIDDFPGTIGFSGFDQTRVMAFQT